MERDRRNILYRQERLPIFQNRMYATAEEAISCPVGDIELVEDQSTGLVYNAAFCEELMRYDSDYQNEQAMSSYFRDHLETVAAIVERTIGQEDLVEVGCGKAYFMEMLLEKGFEVTGFDPTYEGDNARVKRCNFDENSGVTGKGFILRHVLEHIESPVSFLRKLKEANSGDAKIYIEVPCFDWILERRAWFDIFFEHVNYFRMSDFYRMFGEVVECGRLFGDQYLYVVAELGSLKEPRIDHSDRVNFPDDFGADVVSSPEGGQSFSVVWGGASKGVVFSLLKQRNGVAIDAVIDINPGKQGKYLAVTGLPVQSPEEVLPTLPEGSTIYVMNSNYMEEIRSMSKNAFNYIGVDGG